MDGLGSGWMTLPKALPHKYKHLLPSAQIFNGTVIHPLHLYSMKYKHVSTLQVKDWPIFIFRVHGALAIGWMPHGELGWHVWSCRQTDANFLNILKTTEIEQGEEGNTTLIVVNYVSMINSQLLTCTVIKSWLKVVEKGESLSLKLKNISFQQLVN